jgi:hypothetical protein
MGSKHAIIPGDGNRAHFAEKFSHERAKHHCELFDSSEGVMRLVCLVCCVLSVARPAVAGTFFVDLGVGFQNESREEREHQNPFGMIRVRWVPDAPGIEIFAQHISSVPRTDDGIGNNLIGIQSSWSLK